MPTSRRWKTILEFGLIGEPVLEHRAREADVVLLDGMAGGLPNGLVDPAGLDVEIPGGLLRAKERSLIRLKRLVRGIAAMPEEGLEPPTRGL
jgi:hypothetical protein